MLWYVVATNSMPGTLMEKDLKVLKGDTEEPTRGDKDSIQHTAFQTFVLCSSFPLCKIPKYLQAEP
jgi:hypothetical protein